MTTKRLPTGLTEVQAVYSGPEGNLWELIMGEQIHIGGFQQSMVLAEKAGIKAGETVVDFCCCLGAGVRFLAKNFKTKGIGVDGTAHVIEEAKKRATAEGVSAEFHLSDVTKVPLADGIADVVWGEDAWCYVDDKNKLISEAARVLKKGGRIAFSDWIEGPKGLSDAEADRINGFMKFPYMECLDGYKKLLVANGFKIISAEDEGPHFAECIQLYLDMLTKQLTYDALKIIGDNMEMMGAMGGEMVNMLEMAKAGKFSRGRFVAVKE